LHHSPPKNREIIRQEPNNHRTMSLMSSIFGGAPASAKKDKKGDAAPDLFGSKLSVPTILHKKSTLKKKKDDSTSDDKAKDNAESSSTTTGEDQTSSTSDPSSSKQPTPEDDAQTKKSTSASSTTTKKTKEQLKEEEERTIFVGNLPPDTSRRALAGIFKPCGKVESARLRSMAVAGVKLPEDQKGNQSMMKKVCVNTGKFLAGTSKKSAQGYVVFESIESIQNALKLNNTPYESHTIRVDQAAPTIEPSRSVFVGNLPYKADEETLRKHFLDHVSDGEDLNESEGSAISGVRIIRDKETQQCKGFGYVTLRDATLVPAALQLHGSTYMKREVRVMVCGKRFKGNRGGIDSSKQSGRRSFEGQRATGPISTTKQSSSSKRKPDEGTSLLSGAKRRRARSEKKTTTSGSKPGMSKRATVEKKVNKKVKKLEKRAAKGMGKK